MLIQLQRELCSIIYMRRDQRKKLVIKEVNRKKGKQLEENYIFG